MANNESSQGVSTCYVFKSRLQEYAQKAGLPTPVYETIKEGPSHEPIFRSTVIVDNVRYDSLPGFFNRKAAEQSAAEVALMKLLDSGTITSRLSQPVHETGLCKNLLQEYAQKMNFAMPQYESQKSETSYSCTIEIGGMKYIGGEAKTKKEAEIKAARTALLAIQSSGLGPNNKPNDYPVYTVIPQKKVTDLGISNQESAAALKPKKACFKKKKKRNGSDASNQVFTLSDLEVKMVNQAEPEFHENAAVSTQGTESGPAHLAATMDVLVPCSYGDSNEHKTSLMVNQNDYGTLNLGINSQCGGGDMTEVSAATGGMQVTSEVDSSAMFQGELHGGTSCLKQVTSEVDSSAMFQGELHVGTSCLKQVTSEIDSSAMFQGELHGVTSCLKQVTSEVESSAMFQGELDGGTRCLEQVTSEVESSAMFQGELHGGTSCLEQVTSEVDSSAMFQGEQHAGTSCLELQTPRATDADQGRSTNVEAEIS